MKYKVITPVDTTHLNELGQTIVTVRQAGEVIELEDRVAEILLANGSISHVENRPEQPAKRGSKPPTELLASDGGDA